MTNVYVLPRRKFSKALQAMLAAQTGKPVGLKSIPRVQDPSGPTGALVPAIPPYYILYPLNTVTSGPEWATPDADATWTYQVTSVSENGEQLEWLRDNALAAILARVDGGFLYPVTTPGIHEMDRTLKDDNTDIESFGSDLRFDFMVTPSP